MRGLVRGGWSIRFGRWIVRGLVGALGFDGFWQCLFGGWLEECHCVDNLLLQVQVQVRLQVQVQVQARDPVQMSLGLGHPREHHGCPSLLRGHIHIHHPSLQWCRSVSFQCLCQCQCQCLFR